MSKNNSSCKSAEKAARSRGLKGRDKVEQHPVYYRILPNVFLARHLNEAELVDAQMVYHPFRIFCDRFLLEGFLAFSVLLFVVVQICSKRCDVLVYTDRGILLVYTVSAIYQLLFPIVVYFIMRTRKKQAAPEHPDRQGKAPKWMPVLMLFYPVLVLTCYYLFRASIFSNEIVYGMLKISTFISIVSFYTWGYLALGCKTAYYLLLCGAAGALCVFMQFKANSSTLSEIGQYYFFLDISLPFYFAGLGISILAFRALQRFSIRGCT